MKPFLQPLLVTIVSILFTIETDCEAARSHQPILPLSPAELLKYLPTVPTGWKTVESKAQNSFMQWVMSQATREFSYTPPPAGAAAPGETPIPWKTKFRITDTGYFPNLLGEFDEFKVGKYGSTESLMVGAYPARRMAMEGHGNRIHVLIKGRFIVEVQVQNQPPKALMTWLKFMDLDKLKAIPDSGASKLPKQIEIVRIDELDPKNNSVSKVSWMSDEELKASSEGQPR